MQENVVIVIPAHNEEGWIGNTIGLIRKTGLKTDVIVVNDGSSDQTSEIARQKGCHVIDFKRNFGKANAFFAGIKEALKRKPAAVITLDADMVEIPRNNLEGLIENTKEATRSGRVKMIVSVVKEGPVMQAYNFSGIRGFSTPAIHRLVATKFKSVPRGYGLEVFLNKVFRMWHAISVVETQGFVARHGFANEPIMGRQKSEITRTQRRMKKMPKTTRRV